MEETNQEKLNRLLKKSPKEITHEEMMFVLDNMNLESIVEAAFKKHNSELQTLKPNENQQN